MALQYGWLFGARCIIGAGTADERDLSDTVTWSGPATFVPPAGRLSRPAFKNAGGSHFDITPEGQSVAASITLAVDVDGRKSEKTFPVTVVSTIGYARVGDLSKIDADAHGCPACPHPAAGPIITAGGSQVFLADLPVAAVTRAYIRRVVDPRRTRSRAATNGC